MSKRCIKRFIWVITGLYLFLAPVAYGETEENSLLNMVDNLYARRCESPETSRRMMEIIEENLNAHGGNPADYELLWRAARGYLFLGDHAEE